MTDATLSKDIYVQIQNWELSENNSLAPISDFQRNVVLDLSDEISSLLEKKVSLIKRLYNYIYYIVIL